jgi:hypothetical protein
MLSGDTVILQPMKQEPPLMAKCKDKFLICSAEIPVEKESMALTEYVSVRFVKQNPGK